MYNGDQSYKASVHKSKNKSFPIGSVLANFFSIQVCTEGRLILEFTFDDLMRIKSWHMAVRAHRELIPRSAFGMHTHQPGSDPTIIEQLSKNITRQGITNSTLNYLRVSGDNPIKRVVSPLIPFTNFLNVSFVVVCNIRTDAGAHVET